MDEQQEIIKAIRGVDGKIAVEVRKRNALDTLFRTLLHDLMTGKVRVNELEFPASAEGVL
jgi:type I restriction enzyme S subunit